MGKSLALSSCFIAGCDECCDELPSFNYENLYGDLLNNPDIFKSVENQYFDHLICLSPYQEPFNKWISLFKYQGHFELSELISTLLAHHWLALLNKDAIVKPDLVIPVPLHISKWQKRGFNQSTELGRQFAKQIGCGFNDEIIVRNQESLPQAGNSGVERRKNLKGAFNFHRYRHGNDIPQHVLLIDDVVTTGSTVNEISRLLKATGVTKVTVLAICLSTKTKFIS